MTHWPTSDGLKLAGHLALPENRRMRALPGVVLCPGFPSTANGGMRAAERIYPLADRIAQSMEWAALVLNYRGCGDSEGDFTPVKWSDDVASAVDYMHGLEQVEGVWLAGFGIGGALAACVGHDDSRVRGVATMGAPVDLWAKTDESVRVDRCAAEIAPRPMLVLHGSDDREGSPLDARAIADAHGDAGLRIISGASHRLHSDPRCIAILLGWLDSQITLIP